jgi:hypothetical protein
MNDFFKDVFDIARSTAIGLLDQAESFLNDIQKDSISNETNELEDLRMSVDQLEARNDDLEDLVEDLATALQVILDGEMRKDITINWEKYNNLKRNKLEVIFTDDTKGFCTVHISQEKSRND